MKFIVYETVKMLFMLSLLYISKHYWISILLKDKGYIKILWVILFCAVYDISVGALRELIK